METYVYRQGVWLKNRSGYSKKSDIHMFLNIISKTRANMENTVVLFIHFLGFMKHSLTYTGWTSLSLTSWLPCKVSNVWNLHTWLNEDIRWDCSEACSPRDNTCTFKECISMDSLKMIILDYCPGAITGPGQWQHFLTKCIGTHNIWDNS